METSQTRIPHVPDQSQFLERWFEFHQGYRVVKSTNDGSEHRIAVIGEPFHNVSPGFLPRTLDQVRSRRANNAMRAENRFQRRRLSSEEESLQRPQQSLEEALDSLLDAASDEEEEEPARAIAELEAIPSAPPTALPTAPQPRPHRSTSIDVRAQRARERFARVWGTREDVERDDYESPLSTMYSRAWHRHQQAEERRASGNTEAPPLSSLSARERREVDQQIMCLPSIIRGVLRESQRDIDRRIEGAEADTQQLRRGIESLRRLNAMMVRAPSQNPESAAEADDESTPSMPTETGSTQMQPEALNRDNRSNGSSARSQLLASLEQLNRDVATLQQASETFATTQRFTIGRARITARNLDMDRQQDRPAPLEEDQLTKNLTCKICYSQIADIAVLPCGHMAMCLWCADLHIPVKHSHIPVRKSKCPVCRSNVSSRYKIHF